MQKRICVKWLTPDPKQWYWKSICVVFDNESLGFMERTLEMQEIEFKIMEAEIGPL